MPGTLAPCTTAGRHLEPVRRRREPDPRAGIERPALAGPRRPGRARRGPPQLAGYRGDVRVVITGGAGQLAGPASYAPQARARGQRRRPDRARPRRPRRQRTSPRRRARRARRRRRPPRRHRRARARWPARRRRPGWRPLDVLAGAGLPGSAVALPLDGADPAALDRRRARPRAAGLAARRHRDRGRRRPARPPPGSGATPTTCVAARRWCRSLAHRRRRRRRSST